MGETHQKVEARLQSSQAWARITFRRLAALDVSPIYPGRKISDRAGRRRVIDVDAGEVA